MKLGRIGGILLAIWLIVQGLTEFIDLSFNGLGTIMAVLALVAGVFILLSK